MSNRLIGYQSGQGFSMICLGQVRCFSLVLVSVACMATYDPRFILAVGFCFHLSLLFGQDSLARYFFRC